MTITVHTPDVRELTAALPALASWQLPGRPVQLHPGDIGWNWRSGAGCVAAATRIWYRRDDPVILGMLDSPGLLRLAIAPDADDDEAVAEAFLRDVSSPAAGVFTGSAAVEARAGTALRARLRAAGWQDDEVWAPLRYDLDEPVPDVDLDVRVVGPADADDRVALHRAAFPRSQLTRQGWEAMAAGPAYRDAGCLIGRDADGHDVAAVTVWSAGEGRVGLIEPLGAHRDHRGHGHGRAITLAAAARLRAMGACGVVVATPAANERGVAAYASAGFVPDEPVPDLRRAD